MVKELELVVADAAAAEGGRPPRGKPGAQALPDNCANCGAELKGRWCHACGQPADDHRRSLKHLIHEGIEGLFHFDNRIWRTLPPLFLKPGKLINDYFHGRVARHVPPFRLFLITLFLYILAAENVVHGLKHEAEHNAAAGHPSAGIEVKRSADGKTETVNAYPLRATPEERKVIAERVRGSATGGSHAEQWAQDRIARMIENFDMFILLLFSWGHRMAVILLPMQAGLLGLLYLNRKQWLLYDHLIFSMVYLSFSFLVFGLVFLLPMAVRPVGFSLAGLWSIVALFMSLRGAYGSSILGSVLRTGVVWMLSVVGFGILVATLIILSASQL